VGPLVARARLRQHQRPGAQRRAGVVAAASGTVAEVDEPRPPVRAILHPPAPAAWTILGLPVDPAPQLGDLA
jgi:hypothetical protein